jgi:hypothetical protein
LATASILSDSVAECTPVTQQFPGHIVSFDEETISFLDEDTEKLSFTPRSYYCENYAAASALAKKLTEEHLSKYTPLWEKKG